MKNWFATIGAAGAGRDFNRRWRFVMGLISRSEKAPGIVPEAFKFII
jgi:hypothetical protein